MRYLIVCPGKEPFFTSWYDFALHFIDGMVIYDIDVRAYSTDGLHFKQIEFDYL